jgi:NDP-sugar pyrophosphorylase family protein
MEAIILAGGKAERLGDAAGGKPKPLVPVGGKPLAAHQVGLLVRAGVRRVVVACSRGHEQAFRSALSGLGAEIVAAGEPEPLGRGGGIRFAGSLREEDGPVYALNGDELVDVDLRRLLARHCESGAAATLTVARPRSPFGVVDLGENDVVTGFREAGQIPYWVSCGVYVLGDEALARLPEKGDHEASTFPALAAEGALHAYRHEGLWLTVNTPKELRQASEYLAAHPDWLAA